MCCVMNRCVLKIFSFKNCLFYQNSFWVWWTCVLLKTRSGCTDLTCFLENTTSWACFLTSGLNVFSIYAPIQILSVDPCLIPLLKWYYHVPLRKEKYHQQRVLQLILCSLKIHLYQKKQWTKNRPLWHTCFYRQPFWSLTVE